MFDFSFENVIKAFTSAYHSKFGIYYYIFVSSIRSWSWSNEWRMLSIGICSTFSFHLIVLFTSIQFLKQALKVTPHLFSLFSNTLFQLTYSLISDFSDNYEWQARRDVSRYFASKSRVDNILEVSIRKYTFHIVHWQKNNILT